MISSESSALPRCSQLTLTHQLTRPPHGRVDPYECVQHLVTTRPRDGGVLLLQEAPADEL